MNLSVKLARIQRLTRYAIPKNGALHKLQRVKKKLARNGLRRRHFVSCARCIFFFMAGRNFLFPTALRHFGFWLNFGSMIAGQTLQLKGIRATDIKNASVPGLGLCILAPCAIKLTVWGNPTSSFVENTIRRPSKRIYYPR